MAQEKPGQTLQATALVHEAYLRLVGRREVAALGLPRTLLCRCCRGDATDTGRGRARKLAAKRGGRQPNLLTLDQVPAPAKSADILALDECSQDLQRPTHRRPRL